MLNDTELLTQIEHVSDVFTRVMLKTIAADLSDSVEEISMAQFHALRHVAQHGACTIGSLAEGLCVSQPAATMLVDRMTRRGLVERRSSSTDRRQAEVSLTERAKDLLAQIESERSERLGKILGLMGGSEREQFVESLERFISAALKLENAVDEACLRCGIEHYTDCIVNQTHLELAGRGVERT